MWWQMLVNVCKNNKAAVAGVLVFALSIFGVNYVKDLIHAGVLAKQDQKILQLVNEINTLRGQKEAQEQQTASALNNFAKEKEKVAVVQKRVDDLIAERNNSTTVIAHTTFSTIDDCVTELTRVETKYRANEDVYITEIKQDRIVIASCEQVVAAQRTELTTANTIVAKDAEVIGSLTLRVATADQDLVKETDKKKFWRTSAFAEAAVIIGLVLLL